MAIARATVQEDYANNRPFTLPPGTMDLDFDLAGVLKTIDKNKYDVSACKVP
jgi:hypothetical protein